MAVEAALIFCCSSVLKDADGSTEFYDQLRVDKSATPAELKKAYRRRALELHPDKRGSTPEAQAEFSAMKDAYDVLNDPKKRQVYDKLGKTGLTLMDNPMALDPELLMRNFAASGLGDRCKLVGILVVLLGVVVLQPLLVCLAVDGDLAAGTTWMAVFAPTWIFDGLAALAVLLAWTSKIERPEDIPEEEWEDPQPLSAKLAATRDLLLRVSWHVLVVLRMDGDIDVDYVVAGLPLLVSFVVTSASLLSVRQQLLAKAGEIAAALARGDVSSDEEPMLQLEQQGTLAMLQELRGEQVRQLVYAVQALLVLLKVDDSLGDLSWWVVFAPTWCYLATVLADQLQGYLAARRAHADSPAQQEQKEGFLGDEEQPPPSLFGACFLPAVALATACTLVARIDGADYSAFMIAIPVFSILGCVCLCGTCAICCITGELDDEEGEGGDEEDGEGEGDIESGAAVKPAEAELTPPRAEAGAGAGAGAAPAPAPAPAPASVETDDVDVDID